MQSTDLHLYAQWRHHRNAAAFNELARRHAAMVFGTCQRILRSAADAEEVAQECFEALATTAQGPAQNLGGWLHALATRRALNRLKSETRRREREQTFAEAHPTTTEVRWDDLYPLVDEAIATLPEKLREPLIRNFFEGQTHDAIATELDVSRGAVTYRIAQGVERIRKHLKQRGVMTGAAALAALLAENLASAETPAKLTDAIARMALAGPPPVTGAVAGSTVLSSTLIWKASTALICTVLATGVLTGTWRLLHPDPGGVPLPPLAFDGPHAITDPVAAAASPAAEVAVEPVIESVAEVLAYLTTFSGRVVDTDGNPVAGTSVTLKRIFQPFLMAEWDGEDPLGPYVRTQLTDEKGEYRFTAAPLAAETSGQNGSHLFHLVASKDGLGAVENLSGRVHGPRTFSELVLQPLQRITGQVTDASGAPISEINLSVTRTGTDIDSPVPESDIALANEGQFAVTNVVAGRYSIVATAEGFAPGYVETESGQADLYVQLTSGRRITGKVIYRDTGQPVSGVDIETWSRPETVYKTSSDATGAFAFDHLMPEHHFIRLALHGQPFAMDPIIVHAPFSGSMQDSVELQVYQGGSASGRIQGTMPGVQIADMAVQASMPDRPVGYDTPLWRARTDAEGRYRFEGLPEGEFIFIAEHAGAAPVPQRIYPGRLYENIELSIEPASRIAGTVLGTDGSPVTGAWVTAEAESSWYHVKTSTDAEGNFEIWWNNAQLKDEPFRVQAMCDGGISPATEVLRPKTNATRELVLQMEPSSVFEGEVQYANGDPAVGAQVVVRPKNPSTRILGHAGTPRVIGLGHSGILDTRVSASGRFSVGPLPLGAYKVTALPVQDAQAFADSQGAGKRTKELPPVDTIPNAVSRLVQIQQEPAFTQFAFSPELDSPSDILGLVIYAGTPAPGAQVSLGYKAGDPQSTSVRTNAEGRYLFRNVPAGQAKLSVTYTPTGQSQSRLRMIEPRNVEVATGGDTVINVELAAGTADVEGQVLVNGEPRSGMDIGVFMNDGEVVTVGTGADGMYRAEHIAAGPIRVFTAHNSNLGEGPWTRQYYGNVADGETMRVDFEIGSGQLEGTITNLAEGELASVVLAVGEWNTVPTLKELGTLNAPGIIAGQMQYEADGSFAFDNLAAGTYTVMVGALIADMESETYDETTYRAALAHVEIVEGMINEVAVALPPVGAATTSK